MQAESKPRKRQGRPVMMKDRKAFTLNFPADDIRAMEELSEKTGITVSEFVRRAVSEQLVELRNAA